jgi:TatD DNase family protein
MRISWDSHCHLADSRLDGDRDDVTARAGEAGIVAFVQGGVGPDDWVRQAALAARYPSRLFPVYGLHPWWVAERGEEESLRALGRLEEWVSRGVGLGELGLDRGPRCPEGTVPLQLSIFKKQLALAREAGLPLVLHVVKAHAEALGELRGSRWGGIVHSFTQGPDTARAYIELGLHLSVGAAVCRKGFESLKRAVVGIPLEHWVIESDAPDQPIRPGERNEPSSVREAAEAIAALKGVEVDEVLETNRLNLERVFPKAAELFHGSPIDK